MLWKDLGQRTDKTKNESEKNDEKKTENGFQAFKAEVNKQNDGTKKDLSDGTKNCYSSGKLGHTARNCWTSQNSNYRGYGQHNGSLVYLLFPKEVVFHIWHPSFISCLFAGPRRILWVTFRPTDTECRPTPRIADYHRE